MKIYIMKLFQKNVLIPQIEKKIKKKLSLLNLYPTVPPDLFIRKKGIKKSIAILVYAETCAGMKLFFMQGFITIKMPEKNLSPR